MSDLKLYPAELAELSIGQLASLPADELAEVHHNLDHLIAWTKQTRVKLDAALTQRYGEQARTALHDSGRDFGTTHWEDGQTHVKADYPKRVKWDQALLAAISQRIAVSGERPEDYLEIKLSVPESRYTNWPATLQQQFAAARTVEPGKPSFSLTLTSEN